MSNPVTGRQHFMEVTLRVRCDAENRRTEGSATLSRTGNYQRGIKDASIKLRGRDHLAPQRDQ
jgi:hypothetical protein